MTTPTLTSIQTQLEAFAKAREWDLYHSPKNIAMALTVEAAELLEIFQWKTQAESATLNERDQLAARHEIADVLLYLLTISRVLNIDILQAAQEKLELNARKYPVEKSKGNAKKYDQLDD
ncbi:nucleotide pyrophosphohydrolase [Advenella mimigardefordensis]|uniref:Putative pyrophosphatase n=1 Tax=Advenella mimigardefordensis (strain DSM 17166 / LMG 22922 / DPN7) TaxID=1247726 RepID=W0P862_ADVMD|nr:nucleotide pyrophosphohydrolase [Advenella mimigardefordensis]AHG62921.1 putative pyrophosphatase [Advenella mimigardefordensis DPN7]